MKNLEWLIFYLELWIETSAYVANFGATRLCHTDVKNIGGIPHNGSLKILRRTLGHNCTHIIGNLIISDLYATEDETDPDISFFEHVEEITGYLIIMYSNVHTIPLKNLRVIRAENGGYHVGPNSKPAALVIRHNFKNNLALQNIDLRNLKSIVQGSVYIYDNPGLCYLNDRVNWRELFETPGEQFVLGRDSVDEPSELQMSTLHGLESWQGVRRDCSTAVCSALCSHFSSGAQHCWGPSDEQCQQETKCNEVLCNRCFAKGHTNTCCHEQCLGGCTGPGPMDCHACKEYNDFGTCVANCPQNTVLKNGELVRNPGFKYRLGHLCVSSCPPSFLVENDACVTHCTQPGSHAVDNVCQPCEGGHCPKACTLDYPVMLNGLEKKILNAVNIRSLSGCTFLQGNLVLNNESFHEIPSLPKHVPIQNVEELWSLRSLREVTGYIYLDLGFFGDKLKNLSFLGNLMKVSGYDRNVQVSVAILNSQAIIPGLRSLRDVPHGSVIFANNAKLCYVRTLPWNEKILHEDTTQVSGNMRIIVHESPTQEFCEKRGEVCHSSCDPEYGCWGPERGQCVRCLRYRAGERGCVKSCDELPGFMYEPPGSETKFDINAMRNQLVSHPNKPSNNGIQTVRQAPDADFFCQPCHPECAQTCTGPGPDQCIGDCKIAWANGQCVSKCDRFHYLNVDRRICEPCQIHCHQRKLTHQPVCTGPGRHPGPGGCNRCEKVLITKSSKSTIHLDTEVQPPINLVCLRGDCPPGTYLTTEVIQPNSSYAHIAESFASVLPVCQPCHPLCPECSANSVVEAGPNRMGCFVCAGVWFRNTCMEQCPKSETYLVPQIGISNDLEKADFQMESTTVPHVRQMDGRCLACDSACHMGCWGPEASQCNHCLHQRIHLSTTPEVILRRNQKFQVLYRKYLEQRSSTRGLRTSERLGPFVCVVVCPDGLNYTVTDPWSGDSLCYDSPQLSEIHRVKITEESDASNVPFQPTSLESIKTKYEGLGHSHAIVAFFWTGLFGLCMLIPLICYCFLRLRQPKKQGLVDKNLSSASAFLSCYPRLFGQQFSSISESDGSRRHTSGNTWGGDQMELTPLCSENYSSHKSSTNTSDKAPNLGRLVMINSDDLILNEHCGPLGTGAFGAVYRGMWRIPENDTQHRDTSTPDSMKITRPSSMQSSSTVCTNMPPTSDEGEDDLGSKGEGRTGRYSTESFMEQGGRQSISSSTRYRMLPVAVKILNDSRGPNDLQALLDEAKVMASVKHKHCLPLLGVCLSNSRKCLVSAYVMNGSLERYLRTHTADLPSDLLLEWASQIADGMAYLQSRGIIHRDLATRNVLVTTREHLQITDFGLAKMLEGEDEERQGEVIVRSGRVPIRWLAIETLTHGRYSFKTDVWAYGVTLWEIFTFGSKPYDRIETANVKAHILAGGRLTQPEICTIQLYQIMLKCWDENPQSRPTFGDLFALFSECTKNPHLYLHPRAPSTIATEDPYSSVGGDTRSRMTIYPGSMNSTNRPELTSALVHPKAQNYSDAPSRFYGSGNIVAKPLPSTSFVGRRLDARRQMRNSVLVQPTNHSHPTRYLNYQQQKRRSVGSRADNNNLSHSLSLASSGMSDRWSHTTFPHHSQPALLGVKDIAPQPKRPPPHLYPNRDNHRQFNDMQGQLNTDSWASSGQPLLSSDQDSSLSQFVLTNLGYTSSDSRSSMNNHKTTNKIDTTAHSAAMLTSTGSENFAIHALDNITPSTSSQTSDNEMIDPTMPSLNGLSGTMPADFCLEAAAGYVWPQWPSVFSELNRDPSDETQGTASFPDPTNEDSLASLNRQLWLRRSAKQRQFYRRQSQMHRHAALTRTLPEQTIEESVEESTSRRYPGQTGSSFIPNPIDEEGDSGGRYCPDPTEDE